MKRPTKEELQKEILEMVQQNPGITPAAVWKALGRIRISRYFLYGTLSALEEQGLIERRMAGQEKKLFPKGKVPELCLAAVQEKILKIVRKKPGLSLTEIGAEDKSVAHNLLRDIRILEEQHLVYTKKIGIRRFVYPQTEGSLVEESSTERKEKEATFLLDEEIEVLKARGDSAAEISSEIGGAGGRIKSLICSILLKYRVRTLQEAREKFFSSLEKAVSKNR